MGQFQSNIEKTEKIKKPWWEKMAKVYALILLAVTAFIFGLAVATTMQPTGQSSDQVVEETIIELKDLFLGKQEVDTDVFRQVWQIIHDDYLNKSQIDDERLFYGAVAGMVAALGDPHSMFLDPELTEEFTQELDGSFYGIGAEIGRRNGYLVIIAPLPNTPADKAGLRPSDRILAVDNEDMSDVSVDYAVSLIRGDNNTEVVLTIVSKGDNQAREVSITRGKIDIPTVTYALEDNIAIVNIIHFNNDAEDEFDKAAQKILKDNPQGIIIDLRNNPGGFLDMAVKTVSHWLEPKQVVVRETFSDKRDDNDYKAHNKASLAHIPTVVLINEGSASASEIFAGALQDYELATLVGMQTFGKGSVQQLIPLRDDSSLKLTIAHWLTPKGRTIEKEGIVPDIEVDLTYEDYTNDLDPQLDKAKNILLGIEDEEEEGDEE